MFAKLHYSSASWLHTPAATETRLKYSLPLIETNIALWLSVAVSLFRWYKSYKHKNVQTCSVDD